MPECKRIKLSRRKGFSGSKDKNVRKTGFAVRKTGQSGADFGTNCKMPGQNTENLGLAQKLLYLFPANALRFFLWRAAKRDGGPGPLSEENFDFMQS